MSDERYRKIGPPEIRLMEECAEVIKEVSKAARFGWYDWHPGDPDKVTNRLRVVAEMHDLIAVWNELAAIHGLKELTWKDLK